LIHFYKRGTKLLVVAIITHFSLYHL